MGDFIRLLFIEGVCVCTYLRVVPGDFEEISMLHEVVLCQAYITVGSIPKRVETDRETHVKYFKAD